MSGIDIFIAALSAVMFFGGIFLNLKSRRLVDEYNASHKPESPASKPSNLKANKIQK